MQASRQSPIQYQQRSSLITLLILGFLALGVNLLAGRFFNIYFGLGGIFSYYVLYFAVKYGYRVVTVITGVVVGIDTGELNAGQHFPQQELSRPVTWKPMTWALLVIFLWPLLLPLYLLKRQEIFRLGQFVQT